MQDQVALGALALTLLCQGRHRPRSWLAKMLGQEVDFLKIILHNRKPAAPFPAGAKGWRGCALSCRRSALPARLGADRRAAGGQTPPAPPLGASPAGLWGRRLAERAFLIHTPAEPASCRRRAPNARRLPPY